MVEAAVTLFDSPLSPEHYAALDVGHAAAESAAVHADREWFNHALWVIRTMMPGHRFLAEDVAATCRRGNYTTSDARALGNVIREARRQGWIRTTGAAKPAKTSNGSLKPEWERLS